MKLEKLAKLISSLTLEAYRIGKRVGLRWRKQGTNLSYSVQIRQKQERTTPMLQIKMTDEQQVVVRVNPKSMSGKKEAKIDGRPAWVVTEGNCQVNVADDGMSALVVSGEQPGVTLITIQADADLGEGVDTITDTVEITVTDPQAASLGLTNEQPTMKPEAATP